MGRSIDEYDKLLHSDDNYTVNFNAYGLTEFEAQKLFRAIENIVDGVMPENEQ